jgi:tRNA(adenine34) deaminase
MRGREDCAPVAQGIEQRFPKPCVGGSSPPGRTNSPMLHWTHAMSMALEAARGAALRGEVPVGAVLLSPQGTVLACAGNRRQQDQDPTAHAEMVVLREAARKLGGWRLTGTTMVVTLEPCPMCAGALVLARVNRLVYGARDPKAGAVESLYRITEDERLNHRLEVVGGVCAQEAGELLRAFFQERRHKG